MVKKGWIVTYNFSLNLLIQKANPERKKRAEKENAAEKLVDEEMIRILNSYCYNANKIYGVIRSFRAMYNKKTF
jgi:hypothetical protein